MPMRSESVVCAEVVACAHVLRTWADADRLGSNEPVEWPRKFRHMEMFKHRETRQTLEHARPQVPGILQDTSKTKIETISVSCGRYC